MRLSNLKQLKEASYPGNIGAMEMMQFYKIASFSDKNKMKDMIARKDFAAAWEFLQKIVGIKLK